MAHHRDGADAPLLGQRRQHLAQKGQGIALDGQRGQAIGDDKHHIGLGSGQALEQSPRLGAQAPAQIRALQVGGAVLGCAVQVQHRLGVQRL